MFRLLEMRTWQNKLEGIYILILWTMTKFVVSVFRNRHHLIFSRYISTSWLLCIYVFLFLFPTFGVMEEDCWFLVQQILNSVLLLCEFQISNFKWFSQEEVAKEFGIPVQFQRFWIWAKRQNHTYRPNRPLTPQEELQSVCTSPLLLFKGFSNLQA